MKIDVLLGLQWGDEGKGKIVDVLTPGYDIIARFQGGPNAGHTIEFDNKKFILHHLPSGIFYSDKINVIGNGVIIDPYIIAKEFSNLRDNGIQAEENVLISRKAHLILPTHRILDAVYETSKGKLKIGSTLKGIGPAYTDKIARNGIRIGAILENGFFDQYKDLKEKHLQIINSYGFDYRRHELDGLAFDEYEQKWFEAVEEVRHLRFDDTSYFVNENLNSGKRILAEGAQGTLLDIDFGTYPYVTSSTTVAAGVCSGLGLAPSCIDKVFGVFKAYCTRVGSGPFPTESGDQSGNKLREAGNEYGSTTGRPRRCGWLDLAALRYSIMLNGVTTLFMTKTDVLDQFEIIRVGNGYRKGNSLTPRFLTDSGMEGYSPVYHEMKGWNTDLREMTDASEMPAALIEYIKYIEDQAGVPVGMVSVGPDRKKIIHLSHNA